MLVERPQTFSLKESAVRLSEFAQEGKRRMRELARKLLVIGPEEFAERNEFLAAQAI